MSWKVRYWERYLWITLLVALFFIQVKFPSLTESVEARESDDFHKYFDIFSKTLQQVRELYVDPDQVTYKKLIYGAIKGMLAELKDPHTSFMDRNRYSKLREETRGSFGGFGDLYPKTQ